LKEKGESCGFVLMGLDYATIRLIDTQDGIMLQYIECSEALDGTAEQVLKTVKVDAVPLPMPYSNTYMSTTVPPVPPLAYAAADVFVMMKVTPRERKGNVPDLTARFWYSLDGKKWVELTDQTFVGRPGKWIGAKFGFYCNRLAQKNDSGWMQVDWIKVSK
jgi:hypothetical protein